jgi:hypothetical protein
MTRGVPLSEQHDPPRPQDSNLAITLAGLLSALATLGILYISGMFN